MDWKEITDDLYNKISLISGDLYSQIDSSFMRKQTIDSIWITFDMNEFIYQDPFYGEQESTAPFKMSVSPFEGVIGAKIKHIQNLENKVIEGSRTNLKGAFSNSLHFSVPMIKFGEIKGNKIAFEMEYCLTNSDSYGMMSGTIDEHIKSRGKIKVDLKIHDILLLVSKRYSVKRILDAMNPNIYDLKSAKIATDTGISYQDYDQYRVPYKELKFGLNKKKAWWKVKFIIKKRNADRLDANN